MEALRQQDIAFEPEIVDQEESLAFFQAKGERLKSELVQDRTGQVLSH